MRCHLRPWAGPAPFEDSVLALSPGEMWDLVSEVQSDEVTHRLPKSYLRTNLDQILPRKTW